MLIKIKKLVRVHIWISPFPSDFPKKQARIFVRNVACRSVAAADWGLKRVSFPKGCLVVFCLLRTPQCFILFLFICFWGAGICPHVITNETRNNSFILYQPHIYLCTRRKAMKGLFGFLGSFDLHAIYIATHTNTELYTFFFIFTYLN